MMENIALILGSFFTTVGGTGYFTYLFTRKKYEVDVQQGKENVETTAIENDIKLSNHYKEILDDLKKRYEDRYKEFETMMNRKYSLLEEEIKLKDRKIKLQKEEITELRRENRLLKNASNRTK